MSTERAVDNDPSRAPATGRLWSCQTEGCRCRAYFPGPRCPRCRQPGRLIEAMPLELVTQGGITVSDRARYSEPGALAE